jgi:hypothetical protein
MHLLHHLLRKRKSWQQRQRQRQPPEQKSNLFFAFLFQFVCASEKGDLESPMAASCVPAEDVETWVAAKLTTTTTTTTTEETRLPCQK